jgi:hypothetical protein
MIIVDPNVIEKEEKMLFHSLNGIIDPRTIQEHFINFYNLEISPNLNFTKGDLVCIENQILFELFFIVPLEFSLLIGREGNYLGFTLNRNSQRENEEKVESDTRLLDVEVIKRREKEIVNAIAGAIDKKGLSNLFTQTNAFNIKGNIHFKDGEISTHESAIVYKLNFETEFEFGMQIDKHGRLLRFTCLDDDRQAS